MNIGSGRSVAEMAREAGQGKFGDQLYKRYAKVAAINMLSGVKTARNANKSIKGLSKDEFQVMKTTVQSVDEAKTQLLKKIDDSNRGVKKFFNELEQERIDDIDVFLKKTRLLKNTTNLFRDTFDDFNLLNQLKP